MAGEGRVDREAIRRVVAKLDEQIAIRDAFYRGEIAHVSGPKPGTSASTRLERVGRAHERIRRGVHVEGQCATRARSRGQSTRDVAPPDKRPDREQAALYPSEVIALLSCEDVPVYRRELYAVALYAGLRQSECRGLVAGDIDFDHGVINVRRQQKKRNAKGAKTKTSAGVRQVPIHPQLEPLLRALVTRAEVEHARRLLNDENAAPGPLVHVPPVEDCAEKLRDVDLPKAGCTRVELYRDDDEHQHFTFHGLRHTCITHWAVAGMPLPQLLAAAGHTDVDTTRGYIDLGSILRGQRFGEPHPPLPSDLLWSTKRSTLLGAPPKRVVRRKQKGQILEGSDPSSHVALATPAGIEPALPA